MNPIGSISVGPSDRAIEVGSFSLGEGHDTLWVDVQQMSPNQYWNYSFGLLWWESAFGRELGTKKIYGHTIGETHQLTVGRPPSVRAGRLMFAPRAYNRAWISIDNPPIWTLSFSGVSGLIGARSPDAVVSNSVVSAADGSGLRFVQIQFD